MYIVSIKNKTYRWIICSLELSSIERVEWFFSSNFVRVERHLVGQRFRSVQCNLKKKLFSYPGSFAKYIGLDLYCNDSKLFPHCFHLFHQVYKALIELWKRTNKASTQILRPTRYLPARTFAMGREVWSPLVIRQALLKPRNILWLWKVKTTQIFNTQCPG